MPSPALRPILTLDVPLIVVLGERSMSVRDVVALTPGSIIELPKGADEELELLVNNKPVGLGKAVKVGENFGIRLSFVGDIKTRVMALAGPAIATDPKPTPVGALSDESAAAAALAGSAAPAAAAA